MSRKTVRWRKLAVQCGHKATSVLPRRTQGKGTFRADELEMWQIERAVETICCRPMGDEMAARFVAVVGTEGNKPKNWRY